MNWKLLQQMLFHFKSITETNSEKKCTEESGNKKWNRDKKKCRIEHYREQQAEQKKWARWVSSVCDGFDNFAISFTHLRQLSCKFSHLFSVNELRSAYNRKKKSQ